MAQQIAPDDVVALPKQIFEALYRIVESLGRTEVNLLFLEFLSLADQGIEGAEAIEVSIHFQQRSAGRR